MTVLDTTGQIPRDGGNWVDEFAGYAPRRAQRAGPKAAPRTAAPSSATPRFQAVLDQVALEQEEALPGAIRRLPLRERRRLALERLHVSTVPRAERGAKADGRTSIWDIPRVWDSAHGPAPIGFYVIAIVVALFVMLGLVMVLSSTAQNQVGQGYSPFETFSRQAMWAGIGLLGLVVAMRLNLAFVRRLAIVGIVAATAGMLLPFAPGLGTTVNGARAWVMFGGLSVQPSEFLKLAVVLFIADLLVRRQHELTDVKRGLLPLAVLCAITAGACLAQGDLGSAIVMAGIVLAAAFVAGVPLSPIIASLGLATTFAAAVVVSSPYRRQRFAAFLDLAGHKGDEGYQMWQAQLAMASGGLTGSGVGQGNGKLGYLPLAHSDFIFAVVADELGFIGAFAVVGGFAILTWYGIQAALSSPDRFGMLLAGAISAWFGVQAVVNMGGVTGVLPVTGLTLPFFSAGGSSLFVSMTAAGLLLNVARRGATVKQQAT